jgi:hypothetical protein
LTENITSSLTRILYSTSSERDSLTTLPLMVSLSADIESTSTINEFCAGPNEGLCLTDPKLTLSPTQRVSEKQFHYLLQKSS